jgi:hypothetical protein
MSVSERLRPVVRSEMGRLEELGLGTCVKVSELRDKFVLRGDFPRGTLLTFRPEANGFIRADPGGLLFRNASGYLRSCVPDPLLDRAKTSTKGLEFPWTRIDLADVRLLFAIVEWVAFTGSDVPSAPPDS